jgi:isoleucyl-tRNA synthetase
MDAVRRLATLGRAARERVRIRVRQPLGTMYAVVPPSVRMDEGLLEILRDELNVHRIEFMDRAEELVSFSARPNFRVLGARFGKATPRVAEMVKQLDSVALGRFRDGEPLEVELDGERHALTPEEVEIVQSARGDAVVEAEAGFTMALDTTITPELRSEGLARELVNRVQRLRKDSGLEVADRIILGVAGGAELIAAVNGFDAFIRGETLTVELSAREGELDPTGFAAVREVDLDGVAGVIGIGRAAAGGAH